MVWIPFYWVTCMLALYIYSTEYKLHFTLFASRKECKSLVNTHCLLVSPVMLVFSVLGIVCSETISPHFANQSKECDTSFIRFWRPTQLALFPFLFLSSVYFLVKCVIALSSAIAKRLPRASD